MYLQWFGCSQESIWRMFIQTIYFLRQWGRLQRSSANHFTYNFLRTIGIQRDGCGFRSAYWFTLSFEYRHRILQKLISDLFAAWSFMQIITSFPVCLFQNISRCMCVSKFLCLVFRIVQHVCCTWSKLFCWLFRLVLPVGIALVTWWVDHRPREVSSVQATHWNRFQNGGFIRRLLFIRLEPIWRFWAVGIGMQDRVSDEFW